MEKPNLDEVWQTWVKIGQPRSYEELCMMAQSTIRTKIGQTFPALKTKCMIIWYHFLIHPYEKDPANVYFHIRFSLGEGITRVTDLRLPEYCVPPERIQLARTISGIEKGLLQDEDIDDAWRILGTQSEWIIDMINIHKKDVIVPSNQIAQFMHFFLNMLGLGHRAVLFSGPSISF